MKFEKFQIEKKWKVERAAQPFMTLNTQGMINVNRASIKQLFEAKGIDRVEFYFECKLHRIGMKKANNLKGSYKVFTTRNCGTIHCSAFCRKYNISYPQYKIPLEWNSKHGMIITGKVEVRKMEK